MYLYIPEFVSCVYGCLCAWVYTCGGQLLMSVSSSVLLHLIFLTQCLPLNLELTDLPGLAGQETPGMFLSLPCTLRLQAYSAMPSCFYMDLPTEPSLQPRFFMLLFCCFQELVFNGVLLWIFRVFYINYNIICI